MNNNKNFICNECGSTHYAKKAESKQHAGTTFYICRSCGNVMVASKYIPGIYSTPKDSSEETREMMKDASEALEIPMSLVAVNEQEMKDKKEQVLLEQIVNIQKEISDKVSRIIVILDTSCDYDTQDIYKEMEMHVFREAPKATLAHFAGDFETEFSILNKIDDSLEEILDDYSYYDDYEEDEEGISLNNKALEETAIDEDNEIRKAIQELGDLTDDLGNIREIVKKKGTEKEFEIFDKYMEELCSYSLQFGFAQLLENNSEALSALKKAKAVMVDKLIPFKNRFTVNEDDEVKAYHVTITNFKDDILGDIQPQFNKVCNKRELNDLIKQLKDEGVEFRIDELNITNSWKKSEE